MKHLGTKQLTTPRLVLRRFTIEDAQKMYNDWASDRDVTRYLTWTAHNSQEETEDILKSWIESYSDDAMYLWCIEWKDTGEPIGSIGGRSGRGWRSWDILSAKNIGIRVLPLRLCRQ